MDQGISSSLLREAAREGDAKDLQTQLDKGANINSQDDEGNTALHISAERGNAECVKLLLAKGADTSLENTSGHTAYELARDTYNEAVTEIFEDAMRTPKERAEVVARQSNYTNAMAKEKTLQELRTLIRKAEYRVNRTHNEGERKSLEGDLAMATSQLKAITKGGKRKARKTRKASKKRKGTRRA